LGAKVYYYNMQYAIPTGPFAAYSPHGIDVPLIFANVDTAFARSVFGFTSADLPMAKRVHKTWVSFIKTGSPGDALIPWPPFELRHRHTMKIARAGPTVTVDPDRVERGLWQHVI
jgi:carboxylesterase type B